jgi:coenzyme F420-reducing hydrogenase beta subunit
MIGGHVMIDRLDKNACTGCRACGDICPKGAIVFKDNHEGFAYPYIEQDKCVGCGLCEKACPLFHLDDGKKENFTAKVYAAMSKSGRVRDDSTSGGLFRELAVTVLKDGGAVAGCVYSDDYKSAYHTMIDKIDDLPRLMGTKYFQSNTEGIYEKVKKELDNGRKVLFAGTPCQNSALRSFLGREYPNLYQMDFICNSISSPLAYRKYIEELEEKHNSKVAKVRFKDKAFGWARLTFRIKFDNGDEMIKDRYNDMWGKGLIRYNLYQRMSCYNCSFRNSPSLSADITVGDFWGLKYDDPYDNHKGISLAVINTEKGNDLFNKTKDRLFIMPEKIETVREGNPRMLNNPILSNKREKFFKLLQNNSFSKSVEHCVGKNRDLTPEKSIKGHAKNCAKMLIRHVDIPKYIYLNYFSRNVVRKGTAHLIPYKNVILDMDKTSKIIIEGHKDIEIGKNKLKKSKAETLVRMGKNSVWQLHHGGELLYGTTVEIKDNAKLEMGWWGFNTGCVIVDQKYIKFGEGGMCGRNCVFMDSDFHQLRTRNGAMFNPPQDINIEDHVWFTANTRVLKGVTVGENSMIGPNSIIKKNIPPNSSVSIGDELQMTEFNGSWSIMSNNVLKK